MASSRSGTSIPSPERATTFGCCRSRMDWPRPEDGLAAPGAKPQSFLDSRGVKANADFSPDDHWVAYQSNESGTTEVYVASYPKADQKFTISTGGGFNPRWSRSGRELFYKSLNKMMAVDIQTTPSFRAGAPKE